MLQRTLYITEGYLENQNTKEPKKENYLFFNTFHKKDALISYLDSWLNNLVYTVS